MGRISMPQGKGSQLHNRRDYYLIGRDIPDNIDQEKTKDNVVLVDMDIKEAYKDIFGEAVERYNDKQKRDDRKIADYYEKIEHSKNGEKLFYEDVLQWGKQEDFEKNPQLREKAKDALQKYAEDFQERNPNLRVIGAYIHMDEASPHLHLDYIPVAHGYKRGMDTRNSLDKALEEQGIEVKVRKRTVKDKETGEEQEVDLKEGRYNNRTMAWKEHEREYFGNICQEIGLEVEAERNLGRKQLTVDEYKEAIGTYESEQKALIDLDLEKYAQEKKKDVQGELEALKGILDSKTTQVKELDEQLTAKAESVERISKSFDQIAERVPFHEAQTPIVMSEKIIDREKGFLRDEVSHTVYFLMIPASSLEDAESIKREIGDLYIKQYCKESFKDLSEEFEQQAKEQADKMLSDAQERIIKADNILQQQQQILQQANAQAQEIKETAEKECASILEQAKQKASDILAKAQETLANLKAEIKQLFGRRDNLQNEVDHTLENAQLRAEAIIQEAHEKAGTEEIYNAINERLNLIPLYEKVTRRDWMESLYKECKPYMSPEELQAYKELDIYAMRRAWYSRTGGQPNQDLDHVATFSDLAKAVEYYSAIKDSHTNAQEVLQEIRESLEREHEMEHHISR